MDAMNTEPQPVHIAWGNPFKAPSILLANDQLITDATRVSVDCTAGEAPKVFLEFGDRPVDDLELVGVVHVVREVPADPFEAIRDFVGALDADELNKAVLHEMEFSGAETFSEAALTVLRGWANGDQPGERTPQG